MGTRDPRQRPGQHRRLLLLEARPAAVFPYAVLYTVEADYILIIAVAHGKRQPGYWRHRLANRPAR